jgi:hypothetical protein
LRRLGRRIDEFTAFLEGRAGACRALPHPSESFPLIAVFAQYPQFALDYRRLCSLGYIVETEGGPMWGKSKKSLAEYFGGLESPGKKRRWREVEALFGVRGLRNSLSRNGDIFKKPSVDYEALLRGLNSGPVFRG